MKRIFLTLLISLGLITNAFGALTKSSTSVTDWTLVAQNVIGESGTVNISDSYETEIHIQAFLDTTTAHTGTEFIVQISGNTSGDEDWQDFTRFVALIGTANSEAIVDNPLSATSTTINLADTGGQYETAPFGTWLAIEDGTLVNSELVMQATFTINDLITIVDGTTNEHAQNVLMFDYAISRNIMLPLGFQRARVLVNNTYDINGSTLNFKVRVTEVTGL